MKKQEVSMRIQNTVFNKIRDVIRAAVQSKIIKIPDNL